jgi:tripartite-type tricarboxylate transporter receptor subunit TctC
MKLARLVHWTVGLIAAIAPIAPAHSQGYPTRAVTIITSSPAGGGPDVILRVVADRLGLLWKQQIVILNRPGANGLIATRDAIKAKADGYTIYMPLGSIFSVLPEVQRKLPFDLERVLAPIGLVGEQPMLIAIAPSLGVNTLSDLIALTKKHPDKMLFTGGPRGSLPHLTGELLWSRTGIEMDFVHYVEVPRALQDVMGGRIPVIINSASALAGAVQSGSIKVLAVASTKRLPQFLDVPTVAETVPGFAAMGWFPLTVPAETPESIIAQVNQNLRTVLSQAEVVKRLAALGTYANHLSPAETAAYIRRDREVWRPVVRKALAESP